MSFINSYKAPSSKEYPKEVSFRDPYDLNSSIPVPPILETDRLQLVPFTPAIHALPFYTSFAQDKAVLAQYLPIEWPTFESFLSSIETYFRQDSLATLFVMIDKTQPPDANADPRIAGRVAGIIGWAHGSLANLSLEIAPVIVLAAFQRSFVSSHAIGLLLRYVLELPSAGGLGFRRVSWTANPLNEKSISAAERMGFKREGVIRWMWVLPEGKEGSAVEEGRGVGNGRNSVLLSLCWDDWVLSARELVTKKMERV